MILGQNPRSDPEFMIDPPLFRGRFGRKGGSISWDYPDQLHTTEFPQAAGFRYLMSPTVSPIDVETQPKSYLTSLGKSDKFESIAGRRCRESVPRAWKCVLKLFPPIFWMTLCPKTFPDSV